MAKVEQPALPVQERGKPQGRAGKWCFPPARDLCHCLGSSLPLAWCSGMGFSFGPGEHGARDAHIP